MVLLLLLLVVVVVVIVLLFTIFHLQNLHIQKEKNRRLQWIRFVRVKRGPENG